jgi:hypothetical protein
MHVLATLTVGNPPAWQKALIAVRDAMVTPFGLKTSGTVSDACHSGAVGAICPAIGRPRPLCRHKKGMRQQRAFGASQTLTAARPSRLKNPNPVTVTQRSTIHVKLRLATGHASRRR